MKVVVITNHPAPHRQRLFGQLAQRLPDLRVLYEARESVGRGWGPRTSDAYQHEMLANEPIEAVSAARKASTTLAALRRHRPDVVVASGFGASALTAWSWAGRSRRRTLIGWSGGTRLSDRQVGGPRLRMRERLARSAAGWIAYGPEARDYLVQLGVDRDHIEPAGNPYGLDVVAPDLSASGPLRLGFVGPLDWRKGWWIPVIAARAAAERGIEIELSLAADGPGRSLLEQLLVEAKGLKVSWERRVPPERMPALYRELDLLAVPSLVDRWPIVASEATASGVPVACTAPRFSGVPSALSTATAGAEMAAGSIFDLVAAIEGSRAATGLAGTAARIERMQAEISPARVADRWTALITRTQARQGS